MSEKSKLQGAVNFAVGTIIFTYILLAALGIFIGVEDYNKIGNTEYITHYAKDCRESSDHKSIKVCECGAKAYAALTKDKLSVVDAGISGAVGMLTFGYVNLDKRVTKFINLTTDEEAAYFGEQCVVDNDFFNNLKNIMH